MHAQDISDALRQCLPYSTSELCPTRRREPEAADVEISPASPDRPAAAPSSAARDGQREAANVDNSPDASVDLAGDGGISAGGLAGAVLASVVAACAALLLVVCLVRRWRRSRTHGSADAAAVDNSTVRQSFGRSVHALQRDSKRISALVPPVQLWQKSGVYESTVHAAEQGSAGAAQLQSLKATGSSDGAASLLGVNILAVDHACHTRGLQVHPVLA